MTMIPGGIFLPLSITPGEGKKKGRLEKHWRKVKLSTVSPALG